MKNLIITISGDPGSGKSTLAEKLTKEFSAKGGSASGGKAKRIYIGEIRRNLAKSKGITLAELNEYAETHPETDVKIDKEAANEARQLAKKSIVIVEGRTQFYFLPESLKIYVKVSLTEGARRIWKQIQKDAKAKAKRNEGKFESLNDLIKDIKKRIASDKKRYKKYYNLDHTHKSHYDLVIDTTRLNKQQVFKKTYAAIKDLTKTNK
jgi:cytidylate kinase